MFEWIPFAVASVVLLWALASFRHAATGGQRAGLHEMILPGSAPAETATGGGRTGAVVLGAVVVIVAIVLLAYAVFAA